jgi:hypothetical protein
MGLTRLTGRSDDPHPAQGEVAPPPSAELAELLRRASESHSPWHLEFASAVLAELGKRDPDGTLLVSYPDVNHAAALAADWVLDPSLLWVEHLGALYNTTAVRSLLGRDGEPVSRQAVHKRNGLMALATGSGRVVYPAFQFRGRQPVQGLGPVLSVLPESLVSRWTLASWLVTPERDLGDRGPIDVLFDQDLGGVEAVVGVARAWAIQLAN